MMLAGDDPFGAFRCVKKRYMSFNVSLMTISCRRRLTIFLP